MKKTKQVLAIIAIVLLLGMYVAAFVLAFMKSEHAQILFRTALGATILVPVLLYLVLMVARMLKPAKSAVIDAVIFDLGLVLIDWPWEEHAASVGISEEAIREIGEKVIHDPAWLEFDRSEKPEEEIVNDLVKLVPGYEEDLRKLIATMDKCCEPFWYTEGWLKGLRQKGYKLYYLSNWSRTGQHKVAERGAMDFLKLMDGGVWSYEHHEVKPEKEIFQRIIRQYQLNPARTIFIDDNEGNVAAAKKEGLVAIRFLDINDITEKLGSLGVKW